MRTGDHVKHGPTGETWVVGYVDGDRMSWLGWPPGEARTEDCTVVKACTDEEHEQVLRQLAQSQDGKRARMGVLGLAALGKSPLGRGA